jgi:steroid delta-isomerase
MPTADQVRATVDAYVDAYSRNDKAAFLALWAPEGVLEDPVGTPAHQGVEALGAFWDGARELADRIELSPVAVIVAGDEAAMVFEIHAHMGEGGLVLQAVDIMRVDDDGRLLSVRAYWDMATATALQH